MYAMEPWVIVAIACVILCYWFINCFPTKAKQIPPGPFNWPLVGSIFSVNQPLHRCFQRLAAKYGPIIYLKLGMLPILVVNSSEMAKELLKSQDLDFAFRPHTTQFSLVSQGFKGIVFSDYGAYWRAMRKIALVSMFSVARLNSTSQFRENTAGSIIRLINNSCSHEVINLRQRLGEFNVNVVIMLLFGRVPTSSLKALELVKAILALSLSLNIGELFPLLDPLDLHGVYRTLRTKLLPQYKSLSDEMIQECSQSGEDCNVLHSLRKDGNFSDACISTFIMDIISAGVETSQVVAEWILAEVMNNHHVMRKAQSEIDSVVGTSRLVQEADIANLPYLQAIIQEGLRLHPPVPLNAPHYNPNASTIAGYHIPAKTTVLVNLWAIGRDPAHWEEPEVFKPERFLNSEVNVTGQHFEVIPFSSGRRMCPGYPLALRSMSLVVANLLHAFHWKMHIDSCLEEATGTLSCSIRTPLQAHAQPRLEAVAYAPA